MGRFGLNNRQQRVASNQVLVMLYALFWVIPRRLKCIGRRFGTLCLSNINRHLSAYEDGTERDVMI